MSKLKIIFSLTFLFCSFVLVGCDSKEAVKSDASIPTEAAVPKTEKLYFELAIDGQQALQINSEDISTSYNEFGADDKVFRIFAGKEGGTQLVITVPHDIQSPSTTPSGSNEAGSKIFQGSLSLQGFPSKEYTFNNYDGIADPAIPVVPDAVVITESQLAEDKSIILAGTFNTVALGGSNPKNDPNVKDYKVSGKFKIKHQ